MMTLSGAVVAALLGLIATIVVHIVVIARWSGKIDGYIVASAENFRRMENEIEKLRAARHEQEGTLQRHEGLLKEFDRRSSHQHRTSPA